MEEPVMNKSLHLVIALAAWSLFWQEAASQVMDYDGHVYDTVVIGSQVWLKQNLKTTHYRNGLPIPNVSDSLTWASLTSGARCYYANDSATYDSTYGALYNWFAVHDVNEICPEGWHVSSDAEWTAVASFLGGDLTAGGKMKEAGTVHWLPPNIGATNSSGFTGLPGGMRGLASEFGYLNENGLWWCSTQQSSGNGWGRYLWYMFAGIDRNPVPKYVGQSVRCIQDVNTGTGSKKDGPGFDLYPNPAKEQVVIGHAGNSPMDVEIYNSAGQLVIKTTVPGNRTGIDTRSLQPGVYLVRVFGKYWTASQKLIKE